jgi:hypothetical protein
LRRAAYQTLRLRALAASRRRRPTDDGRRTTDDGRKDQFYRMREFAVTDPDGYVIFLAHWIG